MKKIILILLLLFLMAFASCSGDVYNQVPGRPDIESIRNFYGIEFNDANAPHVDALAYLIALHDRFPTGNINENELITGGTLRLPLINAADDVDDAGLTGQLFQSFSVSDNQINAILRPNLLALNNDGRLIIGDNHNCPMLVNIENTGMIINFTLRSDVHIHWHDGTPLTMRNFYDNIHWQINPSRNIIPVRYMRIMGITDYRSGLAGYIPGVILSSDEQTLTIKSNTIPFTSQDSDLLGSPMPSHLFVNVPIPQWDMHLQNIDQSIGYGAFKIEYIVPAERTRLVANEHYWQGTPYLDAIEFIVINEDEALNYLKSGVIDVSSISQSQWLQMNNNDHTFLSRMGTREEMVYFNLGSFQLDVASILQGNLPSFDMTSRNDDHPITNTSFRRAIAYAWDTARINNELSRTLSTPAISFLHPAGNSAFIDVTNAGLSVFDLDTSNNILDEAGFVWGTDGFRLDLNGNPFHVNIVLPLNAESELVFQIHQENLNQIGIDLRLYNDTFMPASAIVGFASQPGLQEDVHMMVIDSFTGMTINNAWGASASNWSGYTSEELTAIIESFQSQYIYDVDYLAALFNNFNNYLLENVPAIPQSWSVALTAINNNVGNWSLSRSSFIPDSFAWHNVGFTQSP